MVRKRNGQWCVLHGHAQKPGSKRDKPKGSVIKCYPGTKEGLERALKMHGAIKASQAARRS